MKIGLRDLAGRARGQVREDLRRDPFLPYLLVLATVLCGFWFWHRIPNFATRDESGRLVDPMRAVGSVLEDPSLGSLQEGVVSSRVPFGATFYLFGLALVPVLVVAFLTDQLDVFHTFADTSNEFGFYPEWHATPEWVWTVSLGLVRVFNVVFAVGCVYLTYRIGTKTRNRVTGRLAALLLTFTFGFLTIAHEGGEDMPALFFVLAALYSVLLYVDSGEIRLFYAGSVLGGVAIAFKLTAVPVVLVIGAAHLLRARHHDSGFLRGLWRPRLVITGASLGALTIALGFPTLLVGGVEDVYLRIFGGPVSRMNQTTGPTAPVWWWFLRGYFSAFGLPLFGATVLGVVASVVHLRKRSGSFEGTALVVTLLGAYLFLFSGWHDFRVHHLLPTFPLALLLLALALDRLREYNGSVARPLVALLLVTSGTYAVSGDLQYASMPRDEANAWLDANAPDDATMEIHRRHLQDSVVPHDMQINHAFGPEDGGEKLVQCPEYVQIEYRDLLLLAEDTYFRQNPAQAEYVRDMLDGEYGYEIVAEFGSRPENFVPVRPTPGSLTEILRLGLTPHTDQYADEQELLPNQYTAILKLTGECDPDRYPPF
jgi:hypothetical protein